jgi:membrane protease YdiL (CAAX protease family)
MTRTCARCGAALASPDRFCSACGAPTAQHVRRRREELQRERRQVSRATSAIACVYAGVLVAIAVLWRAAQRDALTEGQGVWYLLALELGLGALALGILGDGAWRRSAAVHMPIATWWWGPVAGVATFAVGWAYVTALMNLLGAEPEREALTWLAVVEVVVLAPLVEEWLCRGVLWDALRRVTSARNVLVATSLLFGLLHCIDGLIGLPHRFVAGLVFGVLRWRSGSLLPGIAAHATHNVLALW